MPKDKNKPLIRLLTEIEMLQYRHILFYDDLSPNELLFIVLDSCIKYKENLENKIEIEIDKDNLIKIFIKSTNILDKIIAESEEEYNKRFEIDISTCLLGINVNESYRKVFGNTKSTHDGKLFYPYHWTNAKKIFENVEIPSNSYAVHFYQSKIKHDLKEKYDDINEKWCLRNQNTLLGRLFS